MSLHVNFSTHGQDLKNAYNAVLSDNDPTDWLIYSYDKGTNDLRVQGSGDGGLEELNDEFSDGKIQFAYARVIDPNTELPKYVFIAWCGSGVPETRKGFFNSHLIEVENFFKNFHVQINARDEADVEPDLIMKRVSESSGAKYSVHKEQRRAQPAVTPVNSVYKRTEVPDIAAMQRESMKKEGPPAPVGTNYKPVQTVPKPLANRWNTATQQDSGAAAVRAEREKAEREAREREEQLVREQLEKNRALEEQERQRAAQQQQEEEDGLKHAAAAREIAAQRDREAVAAAVAQREQEEAQQREAEEARLRQEQHDAEAAAAAAEEEQRRREQEQEIERQRAEQQRLDNERRQREEQERLEQERVQQEQEAARQTEPAAQHQQTEQTPVASDQGHTTQGVSAVVLFGYAAGEANEMSLAEGEVVVQIDQVDEGWWYGVSEDGKKQGLFPANYVQLLEEEQQSQTQAPPPAAPSAPAAPAAPAARSPSPVQQDQGHTAIALYDYTAGEDNEISFKENQTITHIEFVSEDWWQGVAADGKSVGLFPANHVELQQQQH
ncbi:hypothetical protein BDC45DRAFT_501835 [Circinella umbellata]|nr:hypothetical protein BDC45DRAFT_501835 [Circinella umbellata]